MDLTNHPFDDIAQVRNDLEQAGWAETLNRKAGIDPDTPNPPSPDNWIN